MLKSKTNNSSKMFDGLGPSAKSRVQNCKKGAKNDATLLYFTNKDPPEVREVEPLMPWKGTPLC